MIPAIAMCRFLYLTNTPVLILFLLFWVWIRFLIVVLWSEYWCTMTIPSGDVKKLWPQVSYLIRFRWDAHASGNYVNEDRIQISNCTEYSSLIVVK